MRKTVMEQKAGAVTLEALFHRGTMDKIVRPFLFALHDSKVEGDFTFAGLSQYELVFLLFSNDMDIEINVSGCQGFFLQPSGLSRFYPVPNLGTPLFAVKVEPILQSLQESRAALEVYGDKVYADLQESELQRQKIMRVCLC